VAGTYAKWWEDIRNYLLSLPKEKLSAGDAERYMDLLESTIQRAVVMDPHEVYAPYELYRTQGLEQRAFGIRWKYADDKWWFNEFDRQHLS
jgi:hypothetical protein